MSRRISNALWASALLLVLHCARLGEASVTFSEQDDLPTQQITSNNTKPGMGADGGPYSWSFWVKSRTAANDALLGSFAPFYQLQARLISLTPHFALYLDQSSSVLLPTTTNKSGTTTAASATIAGLATTTDLAVNMRVVGAGIPDNSCIQSITNATTIVLNNSATLSGTPSLNFTDKGDAVLCALEGAYPALKAQYGAGDQPYANNGARIVILAYDIQDDYATTGNYVGGYFAPRDLYANAFTTALFTDPTAIQQYSNFIGILGGYSNEMNIINYDLNPGYSTSPAQVNDIVIHELSHLFTYSRRVVSERLTNHDTWIAEGIAENAPDETQGNLPANTQAVQQLRFTQLASPSVISNYQSAPQLTDFLTWGPKIIGYLQSNLFFNYLRHRAEANATGSAATMLTELITTPDSTINGIDTLIGKYIPGNTFASFYGDYVITHYTMMLGIAVDTTSGVNGAAVPASRFSMANVGIGNSSSTIGGAIKSKYSATIPFNYDAPLCSDSTVGLKPNSYIIFRYKYDGSDKATADTPGSGALAGELPLKYVVNMRTENSLISGSPPSTIAFNTYDAGQTLPFSSFGLSIGDIVHVILYNPNKTGSCRAFDANLIYKRNHSRWAGPYSCSQVTNTNASPDFDWQSGSGACWNNRTNGTYNRPGGIAAYLGGAPPQSPYTPTNFLYITDYNNMSLQRLDLDKGTAMGRLGSVNTTCPTTGNNWDTTTARFESGYCAHDFNSPQGVYADAANNVYISDSSNRRIVKYDAAGNFIAWLGDTTYLWQSAANVTNTTDPNQEFDPRLLWVPWHITGDATYLYIVDNAKHRISRRNLSTGAYAGFIGNGYSGWDTASSHVPGTNGFAQNYFDSPRGISVTATKAYVTDETNQRIVRIDLASGTCDGWIGNGIDGWQTSWTAAASQGAAVRYFKNPSAVANDGTNLYIADRLNNRVVRYTIATGAFNGWLGQGKIGWEMTAAAPASDPYAGVSYYPPEYYAEPQGLAYGQASIKQTKRNYLYVTSVYNGRVTRINLDCADAPSSNACEPLYDPFQYP